VDHCCGFTIIASSQYVRLSSLVDPMRTIVFSLSWKPGCGQITQCWNPWNSAVHVLGSVSLTFMKYLIDMKTQIVQNQHLTQRSPCKYNCSSLWKSSDHYLLIKNLNFVWFTRKISRQCFPFNWKAEIRYLSSRKPKLQIINWVYVFGKQRFSDMNFREWRT